MIYESGALNPNSVKGMLEAERLYEQIRRRRTDYINVSRNSRLSLEQCKIVKNYIFYDYHELSEGYKRFTPDLAMAQSWLRLAERKGNKIMHHDILMLMHELVEINLLVINTNMHQKEAHSLAEKQYNYSNEVRKYYRRLGIII